MVPVLEELRQAQPTHGMTMSMFYEYLGISRQGYYQVKKRWYIRKQMLEEISQLVNRYRLSKDARAGSRSLYYNLGIKQLFAIGVTQFEQLMSENKWVLSQLRVRIVTTNSVKQSWNYENLINGKVLTGINTLVVGDLTYINIHGVRYYLFCLTDVYSSRIVGHHISTRMRSQEALAAFNQWVRLRGKDALKGCIQHTDGGAQYFSAMYLMAVNNCDIVISRANNCLENGHAEQRNGLIKNHLVPLIKNPKVNIPKEVGRLIASYNNNRKQEKLGWLSPAEYEKSQGEKKSNDAKEMFNFEQPQR